KGRSCACRREAEFWGSAARAQRRGRCRAGRGHRFRADDAAPTQGGKGSRRDDELEARLRHLTLVLGRGGSTMSYRVESLAWGLAFLLYAGGAWGEPSASDRATARVLADEAGDALDKKNYEIAADRFGRADALVHAPTLLLGLARAQVGLH